MTLDTLREIPAYEDLPPIWRTCIELAWESYRHGSLPIAAVVTDASGAILARGRNRLSEVHEASPHLPGTPYLTGTPLAHAEVNALLDLGASDARELLLYTTTEPCPLCMGASRMASVDRVTYAARDPWAGCANMATGVPYLARRGPAVQGPVAGLEGAFVAWQVSVHVKVASEEPHFMASWRDVLPDACDAGVRLLERGRLRRAADGGAGAEDGWDIVRAAIG